MKTASLRVLIIEDNHDIVANLYAFLEPLSYELDCAFNGALGLELARQNTFDVIVLDIMLPGMDGLPVCSTLRTTYVFKNLLENTCLYTEAGSIVVSLTSNQFIVADTAPSIPPDVRIRIFEQGVRGQGTTAGSGLGFSLTQRACEHMGWTVTHENASKGDNQFIVSFSRTVSL